MTHMKAQSYAWLVTAFFGLFFIEETRTVFSFVLFCLCDHIVRAIRETESKG